MGASRFPDPPKAIGISLGSVQRIWRAHKLQLLTSTLDEITKEKQRVSEALARVEAQHEKLTGQLSELEATERRAHALQQGHAGNKDGLDQDTDHGHKGGRSSAIRQAPAHYDRKTSQRQAQLAESQRSGPCPGNRQDAAGDHR
jgi:peptidoglycan hydrolase CwlO-like protein